MFIIWNGSEEKPVRAALRSDQPTRGEHVQISSSYYQQHACQHSLVTSPSWQQTTRRAAGQANREWHFHCTHSRRREKQIHDLYSAFFSLRSLFNCIGEYIRRIILRPKGGWYPVSDSRQQGAMLNYPLCLELQLPVVFIADVGVRLVMPHIELGHHVLVAQHIPCDVHCTW